MIKRIVKMSFQPEKLDDFLTVFNASKQKIRNFPGCQHLELWQNTALPSEVFTFSYWESEMDLEAYQRSDLFRNTWAKTKVLFNDKPVAWSVNTTYTVNA